MLCMVRAHLPIVHACGSARQPYVLKPILMCGEYWVSVLSLSLAVKGPDTFVVVPRSVQAPVYRVAQFNCTIAQGQLQWVVRFKDLSFELFWPVQAYQTLIISRGVRVVNTTERDSILFINATQQNNGTQIQCVAALKTFLNRTEKANLTVFGKSCNTRVCRRACVRACLLEHAYGSTCMYRMFRVQFDVGQYLRQVQ